MKQSEAGCFCAPGRSEWRWRGSARGKPVKNLFKVRANAHKHILTAHSSLSLSLWSLDDHSTTMSQRPVEGHSTLAHSRALAARVALLGATRATARLLTGASARTGGTSTALIVNSQLCAAGYSGNGGDATRVTRELVSIEVRSLHKQHTHAHKHKRKHTQTLLYASHYDRNHQFKLSTASFVRSR